MRTIEQMTAKECPALMGTIINIQTMQEKSGLTQLTPLKQLMNMTGEELHTMQDELIPLYNAAIKRARAEKEEDEAERRYFKAHPELNP
jgi:hypothetical protein